MATETKIEVFLVEWHVKFFGKVLSQKVWILSAVGRMASRAFAFYDGAMHRFTLKHILVMADNAQLHPFSPEHEFDIGLVRVVATGTFAFSNWRMWEFPVVLRLFMAHETELSTGRPEQ